MPWQTDSDGGNARDHYKYQYHPGGDPKNPPKDAPSALHSVIVPNVNLPKVRSFCSSQDIGRPGGNKDNALKALLEETLLQDRPAGEMGS